MTIVELLKEADKVILTAEKMAVQFIELSKVFEKDLSRTGSQSASDVKSGLAQRGGITVRLTTVKRLLFIDNYESFYVESLRTLVEEFLQIKSQTSRKLVLRPIIESIYHYAEPSLSNTLHENKGVIRFRYMQVLFFYFLMARIVGGRWIDEYFDFLTVAKKNIPNKKLKLFPLRTEEINNKELFKEKDILKCIDLMAIKRSPTPDPRWYELVYGDASLLVHGNPFGVVTSKPRNLQRREACLLLSILLESLSMAARQMAGNIDVSDDLRVKLLEFCKSSDLFFKGEMKIIWQKLSNAQI